MDRSTIERYRRRLAPRFVVSEVKRISRKIGDRIASPYGRVISLPAVGESRGRALVSFWIDPFLLKPGEKIPTGHTHYWESRQIAIIWTELGYDVDVIHWTNRSFVPEQSYDVCVDVRLNLERLAPLVGEDCLRIQHIETGHHAFHNAAQARRLSELEARRGFRLKPYKLIEVNHAIDSAHFGTTTGNAFTIGTYAHAGRKILRVGISSPVEYPSPASKDFEACRSTFMWFGSGGLVHKGLDLVLDAFAGMPDQRLIVCGPVGRERDFEVAYSRELYALPNIESAGWVENGSPAFSALLARTAGLVYPSCSEGGGGSVITCLHAGLIPILSYEASVDVHDFGVILADSSVETIQRTVREVSSLGAEALRARAVAAWEHARRTHTREAFARGYRGAAEEILAEWRSRRG